MPSLGQSVLAKIKNKSLSNIDFWQKKELNSGIDWDSSARHLVLLSVICVKIYRNIQILEYRFDTIGRAGGEPTQLFDKLQGSHKTLAL